MNLFDMLTKKQLLKIDKTLAGYNYDEMIGGLQELLREAAQGEDTEDKYRYMRIIRATQEAFIAIRKIYEEDE